MLCISNIEFEYVCTVMQNGMGYSGKFGNLSVGKMLWAAHLWSSVKYKQLGKAVTGLLFLRPL